MTYMGPLEKKECLEIRKFAKFESDLLKTNEDIARPQSREILQTFVLLLLDTCERYDVIEMIVRTKKKKKKKKKKIKQEQRKA